MKNFEKYTKQYFLPPVRCMNWAEKDAVDKAPVWCSVDLRDGNQALIEPMSLAQKVEFFKLLLKTKSGNTHKSISEITSADELVSIGFLYENDNDSEYTTFSEAAVSVADIEERSGFTFFRNIDPAIADEVKSQKNLSDWGSAFN